MRVSGASGVVEVVVRINRSDRPVLVATTILHLAAGLAIAGVFADGSRPGAGVGLNVLSGVCGVAAIVAARLIHQKRPFSWWLVLGLVPGLVGLWFVLT